MRQQRCQLWLRIQLRHPAGQRFALPLPPASLPAVVDAGPPLLKALSVGRGVERVPYEYLLRTDHPPDRQ